MKKNFFTVIVLYFFILNPITTQVKIFSPDGTDSLVVTHAQLKWATGNDPFIIEIKPDGTAIDVYKTSNLFEFISISNSSIILDNPEDRFFLSPNTLTTTDKDGSEHTFFFNESSCALKVSDPNNNPSMVFYYLKINELGFSDANGTASIKKGATGNSLELNSDMDYQNNSANFIDGTNNTELKAGSLKHNDPTTGFQGEFTESEMKLENSNGNYSEINSSGTCTRDMLTNRAYCTDSQGCIYETNNTPVASSKLNSTTFQIEHTGTHKFLGSVEVCGTINKPAGTFKIDHPLDPKNKYLYHSFVESPDMMNIYNGNVTTDTDGNATVELPHYFEALNMEFRYQLTVIGTFAQAIIAEEIIDNQFVIKTNQPNVKVSWQVTGVRNDKYAQDNRIQVEVEKEDYAKGTLLYAPERVDPTAEAIAKLKAQQAAENQ